jgi:methionine-rich copper-binding protein CopC
MTVEPSSRVGTRSGRTPAGPVTRQRTKWLWAFILLTASTCLLWQSPDVAQAHATLIGSSPESGSTLGIAPSEIVLEFDENVQMNFAVVNVVRPGGSVVSTGSVSVTDNKVIAAVRPPTKAGVYEAGVYMVSWRVVSDDGHPVDGQFTYTLTDRALSNKRPPNQPAPTATQASSSTDSWLTSGMGQFAIALGIALVGVVLVWFVRRRRR